MKLFLVFASLLLAVSSSTDEELWAKFKQEHGKTYRSLREDKLRFAIFQSNLRTIEEHNAKYEKGEESWFMGINQFTDMTNEEFRKQHLTYKPTELPATARFASFNVTSPTSVPASLDWRAKGVVRSVKDEGNCGSCWAISAAGALEGQVALQNEVYTDLSPQELIDCAKAPKYKNEGCKGGWQDWAYEYVIDHGLSTLKDYPYTATDNECKGSKNTGHVLITGIYHIEPVEEKLKEAVALAGPIAAGINADKFQLYAGGIYNNFHCPNLIDFLVLVVGYGTENHQDYWIVKNQWGTKWGEKGYIKMTRNRFNQCGIASMASFPTAI